MDIYSFINSRDVAAHCRGINKVWTPFEMAVIIGRSRQPMTEKHEAWRELIADYPDMPTSKNIHYDSYDSFHKKLSEVIEYEECVLARFKMPEQGAVYMYKVRWYGENKYSHSVFNSFETALADAKDRWNQTEAPEIIMEKVFAENRGCLEARLGYDGNLYYVGTHGDCSGLFSDIDFHRELDLFMDMFYIDIPVPFKRGDILTIPTNPAPGERDPIFVLDWIDCDDKERLARRLSGGFGDGTDMIGWGFFVSDDGILYGDHTGYYDCFEYYRGKLNDEECLLHYVSLYLKNEIFLPELLAMQCRIMLTHQLNNNLRVNVHGRHILEYQLAENRLTPEEKEKIEQTNGLMPWVAGKLSIHQVEFLAKETGSDTESVQFKLSDGGGYLLGMCAGIVHDEDHYSKTNNSRFNFERRAIARMILESYGHTENDWIDKHAEADKDEA